MGQVGGYAFAASRPARLERTAQPDSAANRRGGPDPDRNTRAARGASPATGCRAKRRRAARRNQRVHRSGAGTAAPHRVTARQRALQRMAVAHQPPVASAVAGAGRWPHGRGLADFGAGRTGRDAPAVSRRLADRLVRGPARAGRGRAGAAGSRLDQCPGQGAATSPVSGGRQRAGAGADAGRTGPGAIDPAARAGHGGQQPRRLVFALSGAVARRQSARSERSRRARTAYPERRATERAGGASQPVADPTARHAAKGAGDGSASPRRAHAATDGGRLHRVGPRGQRAHRRPAVRHAVWRLGARVARAGRAGRSGCRAVASARSASAGRSGLPAALRRCTGAGGCGQSHRTGRAGADPGQQSHVARLSVGRSWSVGLAARPAQCAGVHAARAAIAFRRGDLQRSTQAANRLALRADAVGNAFAPNRPPSNLRGQSPPDGLSGFNTPASRAWKTGAGARGWRSGRSCRPDSRRWRGAGGQRPPADRRAAAGAYRRDRPQIIR